MDPVKLFNGIDNLADIIDTLKTSDEVGGIIRLLNQDEVYSEVLSNADDSVVALEGLFGDLVKKVKNIAEYVALDAKTKEYVKSERRWLEKELSINSITSKVKKVSPDEGKLIIEIITVDRLNKIFDDLMSFGELLLEYSPEKLAEDYSAKQYARYLQNVFVERGMDKYFGYEPKDFDKMDFVSLNLSPYREPVSLNNSGWLNKRNWEELIQRTIKLVMLGQDIAKFGSFSTNLLKSLSAEDLTKERRDTLKELLSKTSTFWTVGRGFTRLSSNADLINGLTATVIKPILEHT